MNPKIAVIKRDCVSLPIYFKSDPCTPVDITGYTLFFTVKTLANIDNADSSALIQKIVTSHTNPTQGESLVELTSTDTNQTAGTYYYDIQVITPAGNIISCEKGQFEIKQDVTKSTAVPSV